MRWHDDRCWRDRRRYSHQRRYRKRVLSHRRPLLVQSKRKRPRREDQGARAHSSGHEDHPERRARKPCLERSPATLAIYDIAREPLRGRWHQLSPRRAVAAAVTATSQPPPVRRRSTVSARSATRGIRRRSTFWSRPCRDERLCSRRSWRNSDRDRRVWPASREHRGHPRRRRAAAGAPFQPTVEVRYCNTACVLAAAGVGAAVVNPFSPRQGGSHELVVRPFTPKTPAVAYMLWSEAEPLSRLAKAFLNEVRQASPLLGHAGS